MNRRGLLVGLAGVLAMPRIIRTSGLIMPLSTLALPPTLILRLYDREATGQYVLRETVRMEDFDFSNGCGRGPHTMTNSTQVWHATVETERFNPAVDGRPAPISVSPRILMAGDYVHLHDMRLGLAT